MVASIKPQLLIWIYSSADIAHTLELKTHIPRLQWKIVEVIFNLSWWPHMWYKFQTQCTYAWRSWYSKSTATSLSLTTSKGLGRGEICTPPILASLSRTMNNSEPLVHAILNPPRIRTKARVLESSSNSHLQYISTIGSTCMHVVQTTCADGRGKWTWHSHTSYLAQHNHCKDTENPHSTSKHNIKTRQNRPTNSSTHGKNGVYSWTQFGRP
jgi:hypothetical protein